MLLICTFQIVPSAHALDVLFGIPAKSSKGVEVRLHEEKQQ
jgi:hypothetical protein